MRERFFLFVFLFNIKRRWDLKIEKKTEVLPQNIFIFVMKWGNIIFLIKS
jgi:hypothetical protein